MRRAPALLGSVLLLALGLAGCFPDLGDCDDVTARTPVYTMEGVPAYEGQAMLIRSCGGGQFCHSQGIDLEDRHGAPGSLNFDLGLASTDGGVGEVERLRAHQRIVYDNRYSLYSEVIGGRMPPGEVGAGVAAGGTIYVHEAGGQPAGAPLAALDSEEGQQILRNWLACGSPLVERTEPLAGGAANTVGDTLPILMIEPLDPNFTAIYTRIIQPTCASELCHGDSASGSLTMRTQREAYDELVGVRAAGRDCRLGGSFRVEAGSPNTSLMIHKLEGTTGGATALCGDPMPKDDDSLPDQWIEAIRQWITDGALDN